MNFLLEITKNDYTDKIIDTKGPTETLLFGLEMLALGMIAVFAVLCLIWLALAVFQKVFAKDNAPRIERIATEQSVPVSIPVQQACAEDEIVAVIAAAIAAAESDMPGIKFRVVSFHRK